MKIKIKIGIFALITGCLFWKCTETREVNPDDLGTDYFPLTTGTYRIYQVGGIRYNSMADSTFFSYMLKESVVDSFENLENGISFKIQREKRSDEQQPWVVDSIWTARKDDRIAVIVENNIPIVKLSFPVGEGITWDGNRLNSLDVDEFEMVDVGLPYTSDYGSFDNSVTVVQEDFPTNLVNTISKKEIFGEDVGLLYKENIILIYNQSTGLINSGLRYYQFLVAYGEE